MAELSDEQLNLRIAEWVGDEGFLPAGCGAGHLADKGDVGFVCPRCFESAFGPDDLLRPDTYVRAIRAHQEWRVQPGRPKHFSGSLDLLMPVVLRWCNHTRRMRQVRFVAADNGTVWLYIDNPGEGRNCSARGWGSRELAAHLLARVFVESMDLFNGEDGESDADA